MSGTGTKSKDPAQAACEKIEKILVETVRDSLKKNNISIKEEGRDAILEKLKPLIKDVAEARANVAEREDALVKGLEACLIEEAKSGNMELLKMLSQDEKKELLTKVAREESDKQEISHIRNSLEMDQYPA
jgi:hypothetical protein